MTELVSATQVCSPEHRTCVSHPQPQCFIPKDLLPSYALSYFRVTTRSLRLRYISVGREKHCFPGVISGWVREHLKCLHVQLIICLKVFTKSSVINIQLIYFDLISRKFHQGTTLKSHQALSSCATPCTKETSPKDLQFLFYTDVNEFPPGCITQGDKN